jgi:hypothetical protein
VAPVRAAEQIAGIDVTVIIEPAYGATPAEGYLPVEVTVDNDTGAEGRWTLRFESVGGSMAPFARSLEESSLVYVRDVVAEAGVRRTFEVLVPLVSSADPWSASLDVTVTGPGLLRVVSRRLMSGRLDPNLPAVAFMPDLAASFALVEPQQDPWQPLPIEKVALAQSFAPSSWRSILCFHALWMSARELRAMVPEAKVAIADWVLQGGHLIVAGEAEALRGLMIPDGELARSRYGFGRITRFDWDERALSKVEVLEQVSDAYRPLVAVDRRIDQRIPPLLFSRGALAVFVIVLTVLIGPINVFYFAGAQRARLLVTTPAIAAGASVVLAVLIFLDEGIGGSGTRAAVHLMMPETGRELILQEQMSRTGVLVSRAFALDDDVWIARYFSAQDPAVSMRFYQDRASRGGDWFRTRAVQAHHMAQIRASRSRVELLGRDAAGRPEVVSSLPVTLARLHYVDADGAVWAGRDLAPGTRAALEPAPAVPSLELGVAPGLIDDALGSALARLGYFYGMAAEMPGVAIETHRSIDWTSSRAVYLGPVASASLAGGQSAAAAPANAQAEAAEATP